MRLLVDKKVKVSVKKFLKKTKKALDNIADVCNNISVMSAIRQAILKEIQKSGLTIYKVAKMVEGKVPQRTGYAFLRGEEDSLTATASVIMNALGLTVTKKSKLKKGTRSRKEV